MYKYTVIQLWLRGTCPMDKSEQQAFKIHVQSKKLSELLRNQIIEPQRQKTYLLACSPNENTNQPAHPRGPIRLFVVRMKKKFHLWLTKMRPVKILIRLRECAVWSESSRGAHFWWYVFVRCGSCRSCNECYFDIFPAFVYTLTSCNIP